MQTHWQAMYLSVTLLANFIMEEESTFIMNRTVIISECYEHKPLDGVYKYKQRWPYFYRYLDDG